MDSLDTKQRMTAFCAVVLAWSTSRVMRYALGTGAKKRTRSIDDGSDPLSCVRRTHTRAACAVTSATTESMGARHASWPRDLRGERRHCNTRPRSLQFFTDVMCCRDGPWKSVRPSYTLPRCAAPPMAGTAPASLARGAAADSTTVAPYAGFAPTFIVHFISMRSAVDEASWRSIVILTVSDLAEASSNVTPWKRRAPSTQARCHPGCAPSTASAMAPSAKVIGTTALPWIM